MTPVQAQEILDAHDITFAVEEEREFLEQGNPELLAAYKALIKIAEGDMRDLGRGE